MCPKTKWSSFYHQVITNDDIASATFCCVDQSLKDPEIRINNVSYYKRLRLILRLNNLESQLHKIYMLNKFGDDLYNDDSVSCCSVVKCNDKKKTIKHDKLHVIDSKYRYGDAFGNIVSPGKGLTCNVNIKPGQPIAYYSGTVVEEDVVSRWSTERRSYLISLFGKGTYLDCYEDAKKGKCKASMANTADHLYDADVDKMLSTKDNNAQIKTTEDKAILYATKNIQKGDEILCYYGDTYFK